MPVSKSVPLILTPAYGRKYKSGLHMINDYMDGKDFKVLNGAYCSCRDFPNEEVILSVGSGRYVYATYNPEDN